MCEQLWQIDFDKENTQKKTSVLLAEDQLNQMGQHSVQGRKAGKKAAW